MRVSAFWVPCPFWAKHATQVGAFVFFVLMTCQTSTQKSFAGCNQMRHRSECEISYGRLCFPALAPGPGTISKGQTTSCYGYVKTLYG